MKFLLSIFGSKSTWYVVCSFLLASLLVWLLGGDILTLIGIVIGWCWIDVIETKWMVRDIQKKLDGK